MCAQKAHIREHKVSRQLLSPAAAQISVAKSGVQTHSALVATIVVLTVLLVIFAAALILIVWLLIRDHLSQPAVPSTALLKSNVTLQMANSETT